MADDRIVVGLDIGTSVIRVAIGEVDENGVLQIIATSAQKSAGMRNGIIVNIEDAKDAIKEAIEAAETKAGVLVNSVIASIGGSQIESQNSRGVVPIRNNSKGGSAPQYNPPHTSGSALKSGIRAWIPPLAGTPGTHGREPGLPHPISWSQRVAGADSRIHQQPPPQHACRIHLYGTLERTAATGREHPGRPHVRSHHSP